LAYLLTKSFINPNVFCAKQGNFLKSSGVFTQALLGSNPTVSARLDTEQDLPYTLQEDIWKLVKAFMAVWVFLYKHPNAVPELEKYLQKIVP
jgi:hypothetical protein